MTAPNQPARALRSPAQDPGLLRLRTADATLSNRLDGVWWPRSRDLAEEMADLVDHFPADRFGRIVRVLVSRPDWDTHPRHVLVRGGYVKAGSFPHDDSNLVHLTTSDRALLHLLVVPPSFTRDQGQEALQAAASHGNTRSASALLQRVVERSATAVPRPRSHSDGVTWWAPDRGSLSCTSRN